MPLRKANGRWHYRFQGEGQIWRGSTGLRATKLNMPEALRRETAARDLVMSGQDPRENRVIPKPFTEAADAFLKWAEGEHRAHPNTHRRLAVSFASLKAFFGGVPVGAITAGKLEEYKTGRRENGIREVTIRHDLHAASKFFRFAIKQRWSALNPVNNVEIPSDADAVRQHVLSDAEEKIYFQRASGDLYDLGRLMLNQGCRPDEIVRLRHADVDLENRTLYIRRGKTKAAKRTLTLGLESAHILAQRLDNGSQWIFPSPKLPGKPIFRLNTQHDEVLFRLNHTKGDKGQWIEKPTEEKILFVLYDFRHTFATRLAQAGVDVATIAKILGHSSLRVVERYIHVTAAHERTEMLRFDAMQQEAQKAHGSFVAVAMPNMVN